MEQLVMQAYARASKTFKNRSQTYKHYALGIRSDGAQVHAVNSAAPYPSPKSHAERRLCARLDWGATVIVVRLDANFELALSKPCRHCERALRRWGVKKVYYSISPNEIGILYLSR